MSKIGSAIVGNGMVGHRFTKDLLDKSNTANFDITVFCEEPRTAYDCVRLLSYFSHHTAEELSLVCEGFHEEHGIKVPVSKRVITTNRQEKVTHPSAGRIAFYDRLIMATGSHPWIPPIKGSDIQDCLAYRAIEDLNAIESHVRRSKCGAVVGGGLSGLGTAGALKNLGIEARIIEPAPMLVAEQLDRIGDKQLRCRIESIGVRVHTSKNTSEIAQEGVEAHKTIRLANSGELEADFIVFSTGIRPRDKLATQYGLDVTPCGGIIISDLCQTSDLDIYATGECTSWSNHVSGLVAPDYKTAQVVIDHILGGKNTFEGAGPSAKLKPLGVDVDGTGDARGHMLDTRSYVYFDGNEEIHKRLTVSEDNKTLLGVVLVGNTSDYGNPLRPVLNTIEPPENPDSPILPAHSGSDKPSIGVDKLLDNAQICSCFNVTRGDLTVAINKGCHTVVVLKVETKADTGCGGYIPLVTQILNTELAEQGIKVNNDLCEYFAYSRQELPHSIRVEGTKTFEELLAKHGKGYGCEVCKSTVGSLLASYWNEYTLKPEHTPLQGSSDNFFTNIQKSGAYLVIPRPPGGEVTLEGLVAVGCVARELNLYTKIIGPQRPATFDARKDDLLEIWRQPIEVGLETGHAYAKALRMAKTCVGSIWYCYGVGDSVGFSVGLGNRYKGTRTPHKMKPDALGCTRECSGAQGRDVGIVATEEGWNLYARGNDGMKPRHADPLVADIDRETLIRHLDRFMMFYIRIVDRLTRTVPRLESLEGNTDYLKAMITNDRLGLNVHLGEKMACPCGAVVCEWIETIGTPPAQTRFKHFTNSDKRDSNVQMVPGREQHRLATPYKRIPVTLVEDNA